ncbi:MAG: hypothetical protein ACLQAT_18840 [Candidatus Binataceae bacterium]
MAVQVPHFAIAQIRKVILPDDLSRLDSLEMRLRIRNENITVRDLTAFLRATERIYGAFSEGGLASYTRSEHDLFEIERIETGSVDLSFVQDITSIVRSHSPIAIFILIFLLRMDKVALSAKHLAEAFRAAAEAFKTYEEGAEIRDRRQKLELTETEVFEPLANYLSYLFRNTSLTRAQRFVKRYLLDAILRIEKGRGANPSP